MATAATTATAPAEADDADFCAKASGDVAIAACTRAIASGNYHGRALEKIYHNRAFEYHRKRDNELAIADYTEAVRIDPDDPDAFYGRGNAWREKHDYDRAIADYGQAIRLDPKFAHAYNNRGIAYARKGEGHHAIADHSQAIRLNPDDAAFYKLRADAYARQNDNDRAITDLDQAIRLDPKFIAAYTSRGDAYAGKGEHARAIAQGADGVVVGSALVDAVRTSLDPAGKATARTVPAVTDLVRTLAAGVRGARRQAAE